jgi:hypothetical protein
MRAKYAREGLEAKMAVIAMRMMAVPRNQSNVRNETSCVYIRKTPYLVAGIAALSDAAMPSPRTVLVSAGSMMPSSQSRAVL